MSTPDLDRAREAAREVVAELWNQIGSPEDRIVKLILSQRAEEAEHFSNSPTFPQWIKDYMKARGLVLRRQAGDK